MRSLAWGAVAALAAGCVAAAVLLVGRVVPGPDPDPAPPASVSAPVADGDGLAPDSPDALPPPPADARVPSDAQASAEARVTAGAPDAQVPPVPGDGGADGPPAGVAGSE